MNTLIVRVLIALSFGIAAGAKILGFYEPGTMFSSLPQLLRLSLVTGEVVLSLWLLSGRMAKTAAFTTLVLLSLFSGAILLEMGKEHPQPCCCLGLAYVKSHDPTMIMRQLQVGLLLDILLMAGAVAIFYDRSRRKIVPSDQAQRP